MSHQEKRNIVNIVSSLLIASIYFSYVFQSYALEGMSTDELLRFWATTLLILIPITIVAKIIIYIIFSIANTIATRENEPPRDERDRLIELRSARGGRVRIWNWFYPFHVCIGHGHVCYYYVYCNY